MDEELYVILPSELCPEGYRGRLDQAMYGTRRASFLWQEEAARALTESK